MQVKNCVKGLTSRHNIFTHVLQNFAKFYTHVKYGCEMHVKCS